MIIQIIAAFFVTVAFAVMFQTSHRQLVYCGLSGAFGWLAYLLSVDNGSSIVLASFFATLVVSIFSTVFSIYREAPITVFQIPGIIPLVPGMGMYRTLYAVVRANYDQAVYYLFETLQIAGAIAIGMMLIYTIQLLLLKAKRTDLQ